MNYSANGLSLTERFEGCKLQAYPDIRGVPTIGYGHTANVQLGMTCTESQATQWLLEDVQWAARVVSSCVQVPLTQSEFDALTDFVFNLGSGNFMHSTLLKLLNNGDYQGAAHQFECWDRAGGQVVAGLLRRRIAEEQEFKQ